MQQLESQSVTNNTDIRLRKRCVDDIFAIVKKDKTEQILQTLNNTIINITFTKDEDMKNNLLFSVSYWLEQHTKHTYCAAKRPTQTKYLISTSITQHNTKYAAYEHLFIRINTYCNTEKAKKTERNYLYSTFIKNNYNRKFINKIINKTQNKTQTNKSNE